MLRKLGPYNAPINVGRELCKQAFWRGVRRVLRAIIAFARINRRKRQKRQKEKQTHED